MINEASEPRPALVREVVAWTLGPLALFIVLSFAASLPMPQSMRSWMVVLVSFANVIGQCVAIKKSTAASAKGQPAALRAFAILCTLASCVLLFIWIGLLAVTGYYATHPDAPPLFGGR